MWTDHRQLGIYLVFGILSLGRPFTHTSTILTMRADHQETATAPAKDKIGPQATTSGGRLRHYCLTTAPFAFPSIT